MSEDPSVKVMWQEYLTTLGESADTTKKTYSSWHFENTEKGANELVDLVLQGKKKATASALWCYEYEKEPVPSEGDYSIVTDWHGKAICIIHTVKIQIVPFKEVTIEMARKEGEGDLSLDYWRNVHTIYFQKECEEIGREFSEEMPVVFEEFELVYF